MDYQILIKTIILYFVLFFVLKFMGKREIGQLSLFDFVVLLIFADIGVSGINDEKNFLVFIIPVIVLAIIQRIISLILLKTPRLRGFFDGKESIIINNGKIRYKEMQKIGYNFDDLLTQLRLKNIRSLEEVKYAILETNGELSVFRKYPSSEEATLKNGSVSLNTPVFEVNLNPFALIVSGNIKEANLKLLKLDRKWLIEAIKKEGIETYKDILYCSYNNSKLFIITNKDVCD